MPLVSLIFEVFPLVFGYFVDGLRAFRSISVLMGMVSSSITRLVAPWGTSLSTLVGSTTVGRW